MLLQAFLETEVPRIAQGFTGPLPAILQETPASSLVAIPGMDKPPHPVEGHGVVYLGDAWHPMTSFAGPPSTIRVIILCQALDKAGDDNY